ncbi:uncharacterized protein LOC131692993 [Topomyia yanbarensis]|uniref:uncharacterized protein LOC131692993 n=1 Tax=Topomyia yanbarensis TaxID=2498891 RepID=UPI00273C0F25|nr:uncharacterized protein LOC131692993 [Topomyia yanbarensis]
MSWMQRIRPLREEQSAANNRVELLTGKGGRGFRGGGSGSGGPPHDKGGCGNFHPDDRCCECGERGHYVRDYTKGRKRSRSRSPRSRSHELRAHSKNYSQSHESSANAVPDRTHRGRLTHSWSRSQTPRSATRSRFRSHCHNGGN